MWVSGREDHVSAHVSLLFDAFQHNIKALDTSTGKSNKLIVPTVWLCRSVILPWLPVMMYSEYVWGSLNYKITSLSHFSASSLCCASKLASVLRALHLMDPAYISNLAHFCSFSPWSIPGDRFFELLPALAVLFFFLLPSCAFNTFLSCLFIELLFYAKTSRPFPCSLWRNGKFPWLQQWGRCVCGEEIIKVSSCEVDM